jgi:DNA repair exonuclease SbcCD ATPase subunit
MEGSKVKEAHDFLESVPTDLPTLEARLSSRLRELCERNSELSRRNIELRGSAEIGWNAEVQIKRLNAIEADLSEKIRDLQFDAEIYATANQEEKKRSAQLEKKISQLEIKIAQLEQVGYEDREQTTARLEHAKKTELELQAEIATLRRSADEAKTNFEKNYALLRAQIDQTVESQTTHFRTQLKEMAQSGLELENELRNVKQASFEREALLERERDALIRAKAE